MPPISSGTTASGDPPAEEVKVCRPEGVSGKVLKVGPLDLDLLILTLTFGFSLKVNLISVLGIVFVALLLRMYA
ncbi:MAG: DUF4321 domain-containing protein [Candidatus Krumholzibacteria bacterium]|nr:DUF4321 domain-containing protein [Candidatus Krumholzibacteria bacterium]